MVVVVMLDCFDGYMVMMVDLGDDLVIIALLDDVD